MRTPTATITDLGTEFGVAVDEQGGTTSHVFHGSVKVQRIGDDKQVAGEVQVLHENQSARVAGRDAARVITVLATPAAAGFVDSAQFSKLASALERQPLERWQAYSRRLRKDPTLVVYYTFESVGSDSFVLPNMSPVGGDLNARVEGPLWTRGRFHDKLALRFRGPQTNDKVLLPQQDRFNFRDAFSILVWFKAEPFTAAHQVLVGKGGSTWRLQQDYASERLTFDTGGEPQASIPPSVTERTTGSTGVVDGHWHLAAAVYEPAGDFARKRLYLDGRLEKENKGPFPLHQSDEQPSIGCNSSWQGCEFAGLIDEVAIFSRGLTAEEIAGFYEAGNPLRLDADGNKRGIE